MQLEYPGYGRPLPAGSPDSVRSAGYAEMRRSMPDASYYPPTSVTYVPNAVAMSYSSTVPARNGSMTRSEPIYTSNGYSNGFSSGTQGSTGFTSYGSYSSNTSIAREPVGRRSPEEYVVDEYTGSPHTSDSALDVSGRPVVSSGNLDRSHPQRRSTNRDEFDGPHQLLPRPPPELIAQQDRDLPHLPTNLHVQEQDQILNRVNDRLSQCAFDFVAKYEFPIPLDSKMRPVERPQDREWTEWVHLLKRLATKRRIPARCLYNNQIKQLITILENSLEMRHAAKHQSRPLKDDRNILQLISAGTQVAKILKDASAMDYLNSLYVSTEQQIQDRSASNRYRS